MQPADSDTQKAERKTIPMQATLAEYRTGQNTRKSVLELSLMAPRGGASASDDSANAIANRLKDSLECICIHYDNTKSKPTKNSKDILSSSAQTAPQLLSIAPGSLKLISNPKPTTQKQKKHGGLSTNAANPSIDLKLLSLGGGFPPSRH